MQGEGTYTYFKTQDIYSGTWKNGKKEGSGRYEYGAEGDKSMLVGTWKAGQIVSGSWELKGAAVYEGEFKLGRPFGPGKFSFASGLTQRGVFVQEKAPEGEEEPADDEAPKPPTVAWKGESIVAL